MRRRQKRGPPCVIAEVEILHANSALGLYGSSDSKTQVLIVQDLFHDPVESSVWLMYSIKHWTQNDYQSTVHLGDVT